MGVNATLNAYHGLRLHMKHRQSSLDRAVPFGLSEAQWYALRWIACCPDMPLILAFDDGCTLPRILRLQDGNSLPVKASRSGPGRAHSWFRIGNKASGSSLGTLTGLVRDTRNGRIYALTAGHVLAEAEGARVGDHVVIFETSGNHDVNGTLAHWTPSFHAGRPTTAVDAAVAALSLDQAHDLIEEGLHLPTGISSPQLDNDLSFRTRGEAVPTRIVGFASAILTTSTGSTIWVDGLAHQAGMLPERGDSGAPLWNSRDRLAAIHIGGDLSDGPGNGIAIPASSALQWCRCDIVERGEPLHVQPAAGPGRGASNEQHAQPLASQSGAAALVLAQTLWGEARGERIAGMEAVACVVLNRVRRQTYWGATVVEVCRKPYQFSCWNATDPNSGKIARLTASSPELVDALSIAQRAIGNQLTDSTARATHYHARRLSPRPRWARGKVPCAEIGNHLFYNDID